MNPADKTMLIALLFYFSCFAFVAAGKEPDLSAVTPEFRNYSGIISQTFVNNSFYTNYYFDTETDDEADSTSSDIPRVSSGENNNAEHEENSDIRKSAKTDFHDKRIRLSFSGGYAYRLNPMQEGVFGRDADRMNGIRHGFEIDVNASVFLFWGFGAGFDYSMALSSHHEENLALPGYFGFGTNGSLENSIYVYYFGPSISYRFGTGNVSYIITASGGYTTYLNKSTANDTTMIDLESSGYGYHLSGSIDYRISRSLTFGATLSYFSSKLDDFTMNQLDNKNSVLSDELMENLDRLNLDLGIRVYFW